jgi:LmbE family N-acetylglucosaminyl deacetylase
MMRSLRLLGTICLAAALAAGAFGCVDGSVRLPDTDLAGPRLLVIAPHPDDETLGAGGVIATARQRGWSVTVVFVTSGDGFWQAVRKRGEPFPTPEAMREYGQRRVAEARRASSALGVPAKDVIFLGFPDGSESALWSDNWDASTPRRATNGALSVPYGFALVPGAPYAGSAVESQLESVIRQARPTTVVLPDPADVNRDHWAVAAFTQAALARTGFAGVSLTYLVHRSDFPAPLGMRPGERLAPPAALEGLPTRWFTMPLATSAVEAQRAALSEYATQLRADKRLVESFVRANALLGLDSPSLSASGTTTLAQAPDRAYKKATPSTTVERVTLTRNGTGATLSAVLRGPVDPSARYVFRARSIGGKGEWRFWSGSVTNGELHATRDSALDVAAPGRLLHASGDTICVQLPPESLADATWLFAGVDVFTGTQYASHSTLQLIRLLPD